MTLETLIIDHGIEALWTIVLMVGVAAYKCLAAKVHKQSADQKALKDGTLALLRSDLIRNYDHYCHRGWIPLYATENVLELYAAYTVLGGNGAVKKLVQELSELPSQKQPHGTPEGL